MKTNLENQLESITKAIETIKESNGKTDEQIISEVRFTQALLEEVIPLIVSNK